MNALYALTWNEKRTPSEVLTLKRLFHGNSDPLWPKNIKTYQAICWFCERTWNAGPRPLCSMKRISREPCSVPAALLVAVVGWQAKVQKSVLDKGLMFLKNSSAKPQEDSQSGWADRGLSPVQFAVSRLFLPLAWSLSLNSLRFTSQNLHAHQLGCNFQCRTKPHGDRRRDMTARLFLESSVIIESARDSDGAGVKSGCPRRVHLNVQSKCWNRCNKNRGPSMNEL